MHYPKAAASLLAGSAARGQAMPNSDYDVVLLFHSPIEGAWREMVNFEDHDFEVFAHDLATLSWFFKEIDVPSGHPVLVKMVAEGLPIEPSSTDLIATAKQLALDTLRSGPIGLDDRTLESRRYAITGLAHALLAPRDEASILAVGASLYNALADFFLRAAGHWSGTGKATSKALAAADPKIADQFAIAFLSLFKAGDAILLQALVDEILTPYGGRIRGGFRQQAPPSWRD
jgi:hypothetical protein